MNNTEILSKVESEFNRPDLVSMTQGWVEDAYRDVMSREKFSWLTATTARNCAAGEYRYSLPIDFNWLLDLVFTNGTTDSWRLKLYSPVEFDTLHPNVLEDSADKPEECCITPGIDPNYAGYNELLVWPAPDVDTYMFTLRYEVNTPTLSGTLIPIIPTKYHAVIVFGSLKRAFARVREYEAAMYWEKQYESMIANMIVDDKKEPPRNMIMLPFSGAQMIYPPSYWKRYNIGGVR